MNHLESLIAKAKAAMPGARQVYDANEGDSNPPRPLWCVANDAGMPQNEDENGLPFHATVDMGTKDDAAFIASCSPRLVLALCELAMVAEARMDFANSFTCVAEVSGVDQPRHSTWDRLEELDKALRAKLAAVRGVGGI